jgi:hypothetical protein
MRMKRLVLVMAVMGLTLGLVGSQALGADGIYVVGMGGTSGRVLKTELLTSATINGFMGTSSWAKLPAPTVPWTYTKLSSTSKLVITYQDYLFAEGADMSTSMYQLRVNDQVSQAGEKGAVLVCPGRSSACIAYGATGVWLGVPKGSATLSIWHREDGCTMCSQNFSGYTTTVIVMEIEK